MKEGWTQGYAGVAPALLSAVLLVFSYPPFRLILLPFVALVPLAVGIASLPSGRSGSAQAARVGFFFGVAHWGILLLWIPLVMGPAFSWAYLAYGALLGILGGLMAVMAWATHRLRHSTGISVAVAFPLVWVGMEWLRGQLPLGFAFPWLGLGLSLTRWPELLGLAELFGESGVAFWVASVNGLLAGAVLRVKTGAGGGAETRKGTGGNEPGWGRTSVLLALLLLVPGSASVLRFQTLPLQAGLRVAVVGTNVPREVRLDPLLSIREAEAQVLNSLGSLEPGGVDLVLLPESVIPVPLGDPRAFPFLQALEEWARVLESPLVFGALEVHSGSGGRDTLTNSAFLISPDGISRSRYDKVHLVPGMELGAYRRGSGAGLLEWRELTVGPLICYESLFGELARRHRREGAQVLLNLSSDVWFGDPQGLLRGLFLHQHGAHLVLRAVENRIPVARSANGGYSFLIDPLGQTVSEVVLPEGGVEVGTLPVYKGNTLFLKTGDLVGPAASLVVLLLLLWSGRPGARERSPSLA